MDETAEISIINLIYGLSKIIDSTLMPLHDHHRRTVITAFHIGKMMSLSKQQHENLVLSSSIHDIGAFSQAEQVSLSNLDFESSNMQFHALAGFAILNEFEKFSDIAQIIKYHHTYLDQADHLHQQGVIPLESYILHVADRIAILSKRKGNILNHAPAIVALINQDAGKKYRTDIVEAFNQLTFYESFWFDIQELSLQSILDQGYSYSALPNNLDTQLAVSRVLRRLIDFRSKFTSTHSSGVSAVASMMAQKLGYTGDDITKFTIAGYIHDIGKLTIPTEILEKNNHLSEQEYNVMRSHAYFTGYYLNNTELFSDIGKWASEHHEKLTGNGYPYHISSDNLCIESRIMALADIFTALTEDRPYRQGLPYSEALRILKTSVDKGELDEDVYAVLAKHAAEIDEHRSQAQQKALLEYHEFISQLAILGHE